MQKRMGTLTCGGARESRFRKRARLHLLFLALATLLVAPAAAKASFHLIKVREVYAGQSDDSYVELQMYAAGQYLLGGHSMTLYASNGTLSHTSTFSGPIANFANQQTILIGDTAVQASFGVAPDLLDAGLTVPAAGGAACWNAGGIPADCVAWGNFSGEAALQAATGTTVGAPVSAGGITTGKAIRRKISPGCPTLLEDADDSNVSATDFEEVAPAPRNDSSPITETICAGVPDTSIDEHPPLSSNSTSAEFSYDAAGATSYECKLDAAVFAACPAGGPQIYSGLAQGSHTFQVRGRNASGPDPTPASFTWTVDTVPPEASLTSHPADPSPGTAASFKYTSNEGGSKFECRLTPVEVGFSACNTQPKVYSKLADGEYEFEVRAIDAAGNVQTSPTVFPWTVDNSLGDTTPPETSIGTKPPDPSGSSTASFTYSSNEPGSTFECKLDVAPFASCSAAGVTYTGLGEGQHTFQVRAIDASENVDPSPAGYTFDVVLALPPAPAPSGAPAPAAAPPPAPVVKHRHHRRRHHRHRRRPHHHRRGTKG
jgi:hypothetical protein